MSSVVQDPYAFWDTCKQVKQRRTFAHWRNQYLFNIEILRHPLLCILRYRQSRRVKRVY